MFQNLKVDIIYYKTNTDFEMEFNLSGCCRMRLLTDKAPDRKTLVNQLARAVSRSRIIIITGCLFGEEGIINTAATAIGKKKSLADNKKFGISGDDKIEIIDNSIPLISKDGFFGGCIIEQGPQTLILLSENKAIRKNIMQSLIHPYIQEFCAAELTEKANEQQGSNIDEAKESVEIIEEENADEIIVESEENDLFEDSEIDGGIVMEEPTASGDELIVAEQDFYDEDEKLADQMIIEDDDYLEEAIKSDAEEIQKEIANSEELIFEPEFLDGKKGKKDTLDYSYMHTDADEYITGEEDEEDEEFEVVGNPLMRMGINLPIIIIAIILLIVAAVLCYSIFVVPQSEGVSATQYLKEAFNTLFG